MPGRLLWVAGQGENDKELFGQGYDVVALWAMCRICPPPQLSVDIAARLCLSMR